MDTGQGMERREGTGRKERWEGRGGMEMKGRGVDSALLARIPVGTYGSLINCTC